MKAPLSAIRPPATSVVAAIGLLFTAMVIVGQRHPGMDSTVYHAGAWAVLSGQPLYDSLAIPLPWADLPFTYPPIAAVLFLPLVPFKLHIVWGIMAALCALALGIVVRTSLGTLVKNPPIWVVNLVAALAFGLQAVWSTVGLGQVNLILMALVAVDVLALRGSRYSGVLTGIAASIKLTPLIFIPHLLLTGRRSDAARATATFLGLQGFAWLVLPGDSWRFWTSAIMEGNGNRTFEASNQSINGLVHRLTGQSPGALAVTIVLSAICLVLMAILVRRLHGHDQPLAALLVTAFCGLLISPISWTHHWVWVVPLCILLGYRAVRRRGAAAKVLLAVVLLAFSIDFRLLVRTGDRLELTWTLTETLLGNAYLWAALVVGGTGIALFMARRRALLPAAGPAPWDLRLGGRRRRPAAGASPGRLRFLTSRIPSPRRSDRSDRHLVDQQRR